MIELQDKDSTASIIVHKEVRGTFYRCNLQQWYSEYMDEWFTGVAVFEYDEPNREWPEIFHRGMTHIEFSEQAAFAEIDRVLKLGASLLEFSKKEKNNEPK